MASSAQDESHPVKDSKPKLWGGRFRGEVDPVMEKFNASIFFDRRMWKVDVQGSQAYARALHQCGLLTLEEEESIQTGLEQILGEWASSTFQLNPQDEDIHSANERRLIELIGPDIGGKLHTGRSRNDQVATDMKLYLSQEIHSTFDPLLREFIEVIATVAESYIEVLMPGYTHLQPAQPIRFSHWLLSHASALLRDHERLCHVQDFVLSDCPLGSGAVAGHAFGLDRGLLAKELGFTSVSMNSYDAVCNRDFITDTLYWASMLMLHLSQLSEDLIVYNHAKMITLSERYSTGSSLMPQKQNPDALELLRGKTGRVIGRLNGFMITLKGLPRSYNKDLQEDKEALFDALDTVHDCIRIATGVVATLSPNPKILTSLLSHEMLATDLAEYLVRKGVAFRETHHIAGQAVKLAEDQGVGIHQLQLEELRGLHVAFEADVMKIWDFEHSVERKSVIGGTAEQCVRDQITFLRKRLG